MVTEVHAPPGVRSFFSGVGSRENIKKSDLIRDQILAGSYAARSGNDLRINLSPAPNPQGSTLSIDQSRKKDYFPISGVATFGNYGSRYASGYVVGTQIMGDIGHGIQITADGTKGIPGFRRISLGSTYYQAGAGVSIVTPYGIYAFSANRTHYRLGKATYPLYPDGTVFSYDFTGTQLIFANTGTRFAVNEGVHHVQYRESVFDGYYTLLDQHYNYLSIGTTLSHGITLDGRAGTLNGGVTFNLGISPASGTLFDNVPGVPTSHFRYTVANFSYEQAMPHGTRLSVSLQGQWSPSTLPSQQQWVLGGFGNLAAWEPGTIVGDSGYVGKLQFDSPTLIRFHSSGRLGLFLEDGAASYASPSRGTPPWQSLTDAGVSLNLQLPYKFSAQVMAALPIASRGFYGNAKHNLALNRLNAFFVIQKGF
jgi:hemolysin activation/secretion protein